MTQKAEIIAELGEQAILLPALVQQALVANDRIKYYFSLLQTARQRADHPGQTPSTLREEREAAGIDDPALDGVVASALRHGKGRYRVPHLDRILQATRVACEEMLRPLVVSDTPGVDSLRSRQEALLDAVREDAPDVIDGDRIKTITSGDCAAGDSLHLLVMDLHRELNGLLDRLATETVDGARAYLLGDEDRELVRAFMGGLNRTAPLKFNHPGLGTTATRAGERLVIQNDIGVTEAHVLVITVAGSTVTITYTDVHMARLAFFQSLFDDRDMAWSDTLSRRSPGKQIGGIYHLTIGTYVAAGPDECRAFLDHLGSRLVFLIDWNKARKQLRNFLLNKDAVSVIRKAARDDAGHRGFLELGGDRLIYAALDLAARVPLRYGEPLHQILGREKTMEYLSWVLGTTAHGLLRGEPRLLIQDRCRAELLRYFRTAQAELLERCTAHATLMIDVALVLETSVIALRADSGLDCLPRNATRAKRWEREADLIVSEVRTLSGRIEEIGFFSSLITAQDDALDYLEEGCFHTTLLAELGRYPRSLKGLEEMAGLAVSAAREFIRALSAAQYTRAGSSREELQEFFAAANRVIALEQEADDALRRTERCLVREVRDAGALHACTELSRILEESTNSLMKAVYVLHDNTLEELRR